MHQTTCDTSGGQCDGPTVWTGAASGGVAEAPRGTSLGQNAGRFRLRKPPQPVPTGQMYGARLRAALDSMARAFLNAGISEFVLGSCTRAVAHGRRQTAGTGGGIISWENFVFKEGGEIFPWRNLGVSAGAGAHARGPAGLSFSCTSLAQGGSGFPRVTKFSPHEIFRGEIVPVQKSPPAPVHCSPLIYLVTREDTCSGDTASVLFNTIVMHMQEEDHRGQ